MSRPAVHQFHAGSAYGDGVTNAMLFTQRLLHDLGLRSEVFAADVDPALADRIHPMAAYPDRPGDVLLVHHSMGHPHDAWVKRLQSRKVLVYHNITPPELLPESGDVRRYARRGHEQVRAWREIFDAAVAVSPYNARDLRDLGYADVRVLPLLVDLERMRHSPVDTTALAARRAEPALNVLFVGRLVPHKRQDALVRTLGALRPMLDRPVRLVLPGHPGDDGYVESLHGLAAEHGVADAVEIPGAIPDDRLAAEYRGCDLLCCLSAHEGFGMPLIEAMTADMPVLATAASAVPDTLGEGGLLLDTPDPDPETAAGALAVLAQDPNLRRRVIRGQRRNLARFERTRLRAALQDLLAELDVPCEAPPDSAAEGPPARLDARVEGPFDSTYSLAIVNRHLAKALDRPDPAFLRAAADAARLHRASAAHGDAEVVLRNCLPPRTDGIAAPTGVIANYAWEESGFPRERTAAFNRDLNLITVTSRYVAKVLADNGVRTPIAVVGNGVDHLADIQPRKPAADLGNATFTFLHVSSCFPRKGADALLEAWAAAFGADDDVALIIKTFPNPHNEIAAQLADLGRRHPRHAPVILIDRDLPAAEIAGLYTAADAFVAPSRGEGFGLPMAEAALFDLPVITTAHSGQRDFCTPETAWLVDYHFARAQTHLDLPNSVWGEPDHADLVRQLRAVRTADPDTRRARAAALRERVTRDFTWDAVAARTRAALAALDDLPSPDLPPRIAWVTSWNTRCGIAAYASYLACRLPQTQLAILANHSDERLGPDGDNVVRCWEQGWHDDLSGLDAAIREHGAEAAVIQFNFGFFDIHAFGRLLTGLQADGIRTYVVLHATADVAKPGLQISLSEIPQALAGCTRLLVHGIDDLNRLKAFGHVDNVALFPHGVGRAPDVDPDAVHARHDLGDGRILASFGFLLPHKGLMELVAAFETLREERPDLQLVMCHALYPVGDSTEARDALQARIARSRHADAITLITDYLPDREALSVLSLAEAVVFPYQHTQESASGAVRFGMASGRPVATTPLPIFDDVADAAHQLPGTDSGAIADGLARLLDDADLRARLGAAQEAWLAARRWEQLSERLWNMLIADARPWRSDWLGLTAGQGPARPAEATPEAAQ